MLLESVGAFLVITDCLVFSRRLFDTYLGKITLFSQVRSWTISCIHCWKVMCSHKMPLLRGLAGHIGKYSRLVVLGPGPG